MRLRYRLLLSIGMTLLCLVAGLQWLTRTHTLQSFRRMETRDTALNNTRVHRALEQTTEALHIKSTDWAEWDDAYAFMADHNKAFIQSNLAPESLEQMKLDAILFLDARGRLFEAATIKRLETLPAPSAQALVRAIGFDSKAKGRQAPLGTLSGLLPFAGAPMEVSVRPILTTRKKGPARGWLVFAHYLDKAAMAEVAERTGLNVRTYTFDETMPAYRRKAMAGLLQKGGSTSLTLDEKTIAGYSLLNDLKGHPLQLIEVLEPRDIYQQGVDSARQLVRMVMLAALAFSVVTLVVLERFVLVRLAKFSGQVEDIGAKRDPLARITLPGGDELSRLADKMNDLLNALDASTKSLRESEERLRVHSENLEQTVEERTREIAHQAFHDSLTGLPNRALFMDRVEQAQTRAAHRRTGTAVLFLDLDNFKLINDSQGHEAGDALLIAMAERLTGCVRPGDTVARLGGDEFTVLLEDLAGEGEAVEIAGRIVEAMRLSVPLPDTDVFVSGSVGVNYTCDPTVEAEALLRDADTAMYHAKAQGKAAYALFDPAMNALVVERVELEMGLRLALERKELRVHYQPLIDLESGMINGAEALARWQHPERGLIPPSMFIPIAEETGLIVPLGYWILEEACRQTKEWLKSFPEVPFTISVNLSGRQLQRTDVVDRVREILERVGLAGSYLKLEITESVLMSDMDDIIDKLTRLKALGTKLAIDDFGTGYSSMSTLSAYPVDTVKIDRAFINRLNDEQEGGAVVAAIIMLSKAMKLDVTAEGLETEDQLIQLQGMGCTTGQGYYFARPMADAALGGGLAKGPHSFMPQRQTVEKSGIDELLQMYLDSYDHKAA